MAQPLRVSLPGNGWKPRPDQMPLWSYLERGGKRADICAHRRWGKDDVCLHWAATAAHQRVGTYWHMLPEASQARKAIWDAINPRTGKRRIDEAFPRELRNSTREQEMMITFKCGSSWQVLGSDNYDSFVGSPPVGITYSEWSLAKPAGWSYTRPILLENNGWALFIWTPRGRNHATRSFEAREKDSMWFTRRIPAARQIVGEGDQYTEEFEAMTPVFTVAQLLQELHELIDETGSLEEGWAIFRTEYLVDFDAPVPGSYYGAQMQAALTSGRIGKVPYNPAFKVDTAWDLGMDDYTAIWFLQRVAAQRLNAIAFYETSDVGFDTIVSEAFGGERKKWKFGMHYLPHDVAVRELGAGGRGRRQSLHLLGIRPIRVGVARDPQERINATRRLLPMTWFDADACEEGIDHIKNYRKAWNTTLHKYTGPLHNSDSHGADALGEFAVNATLPKLQKPANDDKPRPSAPGWGFKPVRKRVIVPGWKVA